MGEPFSLADMLTGSQPPARQIEKQASARGDGSAKLDHACREFESIFLNLMMQQMRQTIPQDGLFSGGRAEEVYTSMLDNEMARSISQHKSLGLAAMMFRQLKTQLGPENNE